MAYKYRKPNKYYRFIPRSKKHMQDFQDWLIDHGFDVLSKAAFTRGEVIAFNGTGGRGSLFETGYANELCIKMLNRYMQDSKK